MGKTMFVLNILDSKRQEMIELGMKKGFGHPDTIRVSQELDMLVLDAMKAQS
jgi:S-adenosylmethionine synthetase